MVPAYSFSRPKLFEQGRCATVGVCTGLPRLSAARAHWAVGSVATTKTLVPAGCTPPCPSQSKCYQFPDPPSRLHTAIATVHHRVRSPSPRVPRSCSQPGFAPGDQRVASDWPGWRPTMAVELGTFPAEVACAHCGDRSPAPGPSAVAVARRTEVSSPPQPAPTARFRCPHCGVWRTSSRRLCGSCGADTETGSVPPSAASAAAPASDRSCR